MTDQSIKADAGKLRPSLVPSEIIRAVARVREYGVAKYGEKESWREVEVDRYREALLRHILAYKDDPDGVDEESGLPHLEHVACNVAFLLEMGKMPKPEETERCRSCEFGLSRDDVFGHFTYCLDKKVVVDPKCDCEKWREKKTNSIECSYYDCICRSCGRVRECFFSRCLQCDKGSKAERACVARLKKEEG